MTGKLVCLPALRVWIRHVFHLPSSCSKCYGHAFWVCEDCQGDGEEECNLGHSHDCESCDGLGTQQCPLCTTDDMACPSDIPEYFVNLAGVTLRTWDLLRAIDQIHHAIVRVRVVRGNLQFKHGDHTWPVLGRPIYKRGPDEPDVKPVEYPLGQGVLPLEAA